MSYGKETENSYNMSSGYKLSSSVFRKIYNNGKEAILNINRLVKDVEKRIKNRQIKKQKKPEKSER
ncbi:hypothetical protein EII29_08055 [Leptotrichia sp. OH3620_COT-345]|nr:hypothetical protein EII29_08055 [Leptotrichia sp. OH3620_COT-345]